jgi:hypothetical protein
MSHQAGYESLCHQMLRQFGDTTTPTNAERTVKTCLMGGPSRGSQQQLAKLALFAVEHGQGPHLFYFEFCRGLSEYRQGRYAAALEWFARSRKHHAEQKQPDPTVEPLNNLFTAMSLYRLGRKGEANRFFISAVAEIEQSYNAGLDSGFWHDWLFCQIALKEAKAVLTGT